MRPAALFCFPISVSICRKSTPFTIKIFLPYGQHDRIRFVSSRTYLLGIIHSISLKLTSYLNDRIFSSMNSYSSLSQSHNYPEHLVCSMSYLYIQSKALFIDSSCSSLFHCSKKSLNSLFFALPSLKTMSRTRSRTFLFLSFLSWP